VAWSVFEEQKTKDISFHVLLSGHLRQKLLQGQQTNNISDSGIRTEIEDWLAHLPYPKNGCWDQNKRGAKSVLRHQRRVEIAGRQNAASLPGLASATARHVRDYEPGRKRYRNNFGTQWLKPVEVPR
jgi:hypothetical protein